MNSFHSTFLIACLLVSFAITNCSVQDPEYAFLLKRAEADPGKNAIIGMWHRRDNAAGTASFSLKARNSFLFKADGSGVFRWVLIADASRPDLSSTEVENFRWNYDGGGIWTARYPTGAFEFRISGDALLLKGGGLGKTHQMVFERPQ